MFYLPIAMGILYFYINNQILLIMEQENDSKHQEWLVLIGKQVRRLRKEKTNLNYIDFATTIGLDKKTYYKIERGEGEYNITTLMKIISHYPKLTLSKFFRLAGL